MTISYALASKRKLALAMYRVMTIGSYEFSYGHEDNIEDDEAQKIKYKMETRVQWYLCTMTGIDWSVIRHIKELDIEDCQRIVNTLSLVDYEHIRSWWSTTGRDAFYQAKEDRKQQARLDSLAIVFRVNDEGFIKQGEIGSYSVVKTPAEATGWAHCCDIELLERVFNEHYFTVKPIVLNKEAVGNLIEAS